MKTWNIRGRESSICPMSLEKRFKIPPAGTRYEKLLISPCNRLIILFKQVIHKKQTQNWTFLTLQYSTLKSTVVQYSCWHMVTGVNKKSYWLEEEQEVGDGRAEGSSAVGIEGKLQFNSCLMLMAKVLVPCWIQFYLPSWKNNPVMSQQYCTSYKCLEYEASHWLKLPALTRYHSNHLN